MSVHYIETPKPGVVKPPEKKTVAKKGRAIEQISEFVDFLLERSYFSKAEKLLNQTLKKYPQASLLWSKLGVVYSKQYKGAEAKTAFEKALQYDPNNMEALFHLGRFKESCELPRDYYYLGLCNCQFKKLPEAFDAFVKAYESGYLALEIIQLYLTAANVAENLDFKEAFEDALITMNKMLSFANKYFNSGTRIELITKKTSSKRAYDRLILAAKLICEKAIKETPRNAEAYYNLGIIYFMQEKHAKARENFAKAVELNPRHAFAHLQLGFLCLAEGKAEESEKYLEQAHQLFKEGGMEEMFLEKIEILKDGVK